MQKTIGEYIKFTNKTFRKTYNYFILNKINEKSIRVLKEKIGDDDDYTVGRSVIQGKDIDDMFRIERNAYHVIQKLDIEKLKGITSLEEISNGKFRNFIL